jgi:pilus assembly protein CpaB
MDAKKIALLVGALLIAVVAALMARSMLSGGGPAPAADAQAVPAQQQQDMPQVLVAKKALPVGTILDPDSFAFQPWPKDLVEENYFLQGKNDPTKLVGAVVRTAISAGQPVTQGGVIQPGDRGFLAAALGPGMRAVTVPVSAQSSVAGFIFPGDRVDLMLTQTVPGGGDGAPLKATETVVRNLRVLATDQRTNALDDQGKPVVQTYSNVTLEVTPKIAEKITVAQTIGSLSMSLRSIADTPSELEAAIASSDVAMPSGDDPAAEKSVLAQIAARPNDARSSFATGADVSRFQRSTVPSKPADPNSPTAIRAAMGPVVRVARGTEVSTVPVGGK